MTNQTARTRVLTGLRANSSLTIANYFGAMLPMADLARKHKDTHDFFMFVPDLHSFTTPIDHSQLYANILQNVKYFIAAGAVDIKNQHSIVYRQSRVPAHSELTWILDCFAHMGELSRMTQFKDKAGLGPAEETELLSVLRHKTRQFSNRFLKSLVEHDFREVLNDLKNESVSVGLFNYPVLMAADILLYGAQYVPLGDDQRQHLELTRDLAQRLNERFKDVFPDGVFQTIPENWDQQLKFARGGEQGLRIRSLRNPEKKMSKSDADPAGYITLNDDPAKAAKKIMAATTDSYGAIHFDWKRQPGVTNLMQILSLLSGDDIQKVITQWQGRSNYGELKKAVSGHISDFLGQFQEKLKKLDDNAVLQQLESGEKTANQIANQQLSRVQQAVGLRPRS